MMNKMNGSESIFGFVGWLTTRRESITMGAAYDAAAPCDLIAEFCRVNNLPEPRQGWEDNLTHPISNDLLGAANTAVVATPHHRAVRTGHRR